MGDLGGDGAGPGGRQGTLVDDRGQRAAVQELHHQIEAAAWEGAEIGDIDRVGVVDLGGQPRLAQEPPGVLVVARLEHHLDGKAASQSLVPCDIHRAHTPLSDLLQNLIAVGDDQADKVLWRCALADRDRRRPVHGRRFPGHRPRRSRQGFGERPGMGVRSLAPVHRARSHIRAGAGAGVSSLDSRQSRCSAARSRGAARSRREIVRHEVLHCSMT